MTDETHQKDLDGSQDVHGSSEGGAQVETQAHRPPKLRTQRTTDHEVGSSRWTGSREKEEQREKEGQVAHQGWEEVEMRERQENKKEGNLRNCKRIQRAMMDERRWDKKKEERDGCQ